MTLSADEDRPLAGVSELTDRIAVGPFAVGEMEEFLHSLPLVSWNGCGKSWPAGTTREGASGEEGSRDRVSRQPDL